MGRINGVYEKLEKVRSLSTVQFQSLYSSDFQNKSEFIDAIVYKKPGILIFVGHGGLEAGLILRFSDESTNNLSEDEMELLMANLNETSNSGVLLLGCNPKIYLSKELEPGFCRYFVYSDSTTAFSIDVFLDGFFRVYNICFDFKKAFYAGRMALSFWGINEIDYLLNVFDKERGEWIPCV
jgi:hypothetical protein